MKRNKPTHRSNVDHERLSAADRAILDRVIEDLRGLLARNQSSTSGFEAALNSLGIEPRAK